MILQNVQHETQAQLQQHRRGRQRGRPARRATTTALQFTGMTVYTNAAVAADRMAAFDAQYPPTISMHRVTPRINNNNNNNGNDNNNKYQMIYTHHDIT